ncbi:MAG TPA: helicase HerA-like domain-containing protein, partial [bacterium]|nr:helicase HerA-like domain-containing protein [bacterium]
MEKTYIGKIYSVRGMTVEAEVERDFSELKLLGEKRSFLPSQVGSYVLIHGRFEKQVGIISEVRRMPIEETREGRIEFKIKSVMIVQLVGSLGEKSFQRGYVLPPFVGEEVHFPEPQDFERIFSGQQKELSIKVGHFHQMEEIPVLLHLDRLLARHTAVVGNTGSGKSTTVATLVMRLIEKYDHAHIALFDIHGEYSLISHPRVKQIKADALKIPHWLLSFPQWKTLLNVGFRTSEPWDALKEAITELKCRYNKDIEPSKISVDMPVYFPVEKLLQHPRIVGEECAIMRERIETLIKDSRYFNILKSGYDSTETLKDFTQLILDKNAGCTVLNLSKIMPDMLNFVVEILSRLFFRFCYWNLNRDYPLLLVYEEGHRYLGRDDAPHSATRRVEDIAKEGRKYGVGLMIVTQRPSDISETILAQCNNFIAHRLTTDRDKNFLMSLLP